MEALHAFVLSEEQQEQGLIVVPNPDFPVRKPHTASFRVREAPYSPLVIEWQCAAHHRIRTRIESGFIAVPHCAKCKGAPRAVSGSVVNEEDPLAICAFTADQAIAIRTSRLWKYMIQMLDFISGRDGAGRVSALYCIACAESNHMGKCSCPCHDLQAYRREVERA